ncbi:hypothetical protein ACP275_03G004900 [Erythranthe tilingii]
MGSKSNTQILEELEALSGTLYQSQTAANPARRTASLVLPRNAIPPIIPPSSADEIKDDVIALNPKPRSRRMSLSPWRSRPQKPEYTEEENDYRNKDPQNSTKSNKWSDEQTSSSSEKKGIWGWKPLRALTHIAMQKLSCLFSIEVVTVQGLPASMNGLRLSVCVRKKENRDGAVQTMPSRVSQGAADFEETLFVRCHVYFTPSSGGGRAKFEPRPFLIYVLAVDAEELDFGRSSVDLSGLIQESIEKNFEGTRIKTWDTSFRLSGKAKGGELVIKLGFQIMDKDGGIGLYSQASEGQKSGGGNKSRNFSPSIVARKQSKTSFSVASPRLTSRAEAWTPSQKGVNESSLDDHMDDLNLDEPAPPPQPIKSPPPPQETKIEEVDFPDFDIEDKGVEIDQNKDEEEEERYSEENSDKRSVSSEVVKEVVQDQSHIITRLSELDSIAQQIKALESMMGSENGKGSKITDEEETGSQTLDADEDKVTREFLQLLEDGEEDNNKLNDDQISLSKLKNYDEQSEETESEVFIPDLGKGLGCVVQTRNGGYLAAMNPLNTVGSRKETPKLAMQMSKPVIIQSNKTGFELFQILAAIGVQELTSEISSLMPIDELMGKTAEQIAFEGIASAIIQGRNKEGASSTAARTVASVKSMANAMNNGRKERVSSGIWSVSEDPLSIEDILAFSMQKIESMAIDALKIQADIAEEEAPFDVSTNPSSELGENNSNNLLASAVAIEDWAKSNSGYSDSEIVTVAVVVQLRDPMRQYEPVGGPMVAMIHANESEKDCYDEDEEKKYRVGSLQVGSVKVRGSSGIKNLWDNEKQKLTALQWLLAFGMGKAGKKGKRVAVNGPDLMWSVSSRVMADMWLKPIRNPDVKFNK